MGLETTVTQYRLLASPQFESWREHRVRIRQVASYGSFAILRPEWMELAQAFAGPPGAGRQPGQFAPPDQEGARVERRVQERE